LQLRTQLTYPLRRLGLEMNAELAARMFRPLYMQWSGDCVEACAARVVRAAEKLAMRLLLRAPAATAIALLSIALSVGASAVVFATVKAVLLDLLPYRDPLAALRTE
jgi:hypothetical protein